VLPKIGHVHQGRAQRSVATSRSAACAMVPSEFMTSQHTLTGGSPAATHNATVAPV
jgi:hypothetical protein